MKTFKTSLVAILTLLALACGSRNANIDRTTFPTEDPQQKPITEIDARNVTPPSRFDIKAPQGVPNVVIVLIDDMGFGQPSAFGGGISMPTLDRLADNGVRYNNFHTTALCSPTRTALLTGRNHHSNNAGAIMEVATAFPGNTGIRPQSITPIAEILRFNGYNTAAFGKYHETPPWEVSVSGPFDRWPTKSGFDKFYGFIGGETNQWKPNIYDGLTRIEPPKKSNYHFTTDMTDQAIAWVRYQQAITPDKPFFVYYAPGATHAPHHVPKEWIKKYKGKFDQGWDKYREETFARQKRLGIIPRDTKLAPKPKEIKDWNTLTTDEKRLFARQMEVFAGFAEHTDHEVGRLVNALEGMNEFENTLFVYMAGDNGASAEGGMVGMYNEMTYFNGVSETVKDQLKVIDKLGGPETFSHYAAGWAVAGNTPFTWTKQVASNYGGTRNGMVVHWPKGIKSKGSTRQQFHHVIDIAPTILEVTGLPEPKTVNGIKQHPIEGVSMAYSFDNNAVESKRDTQYFEMFGNRAIYHDGWFAGTIHRAPWEYSPRAALQNDTWELYNTRNDFSLSNNLAKSNPDKLKELQSVFIDEAVKYSVLPIDDRGLERFDPVQAGRPDIMGDRTSLTLYEGMTGMMENAFINVKNRSKKITAEVETNTVGTNGVILAQGGKFGGWSIYLNNGRPTYTYNWVGLKKYTIASNQVLPTGKSTIDFDFKYDGGKTGAGGVGTMYVNGNKVASGRIENTNASIFSAEETADVGVDLGTAVAETYSDENNNFTGKINRVTVEVG